MAIYVHTCCTFGASVQPDLSGALASDIGARVEPVVATAMPVRTVETSVAPSAATMGSR